MLKAWQFWRKKDSWIKFESLRVWRKFSLNGECFLPSYRWDPAHSIHFSPHQNARFSHLRQPFWSTFRVSTPAFFCLFICALSQLWTTIRDAQRNNNKHRTNVRRNKDDGNDQWIGEDVEIKDQKQKMRRGRIRTSCREFVCWMFLVLLSWIDAYHPFGIPSWNEHKLITMLTTQTTM